MSDSTNPLTVPAKYADQLRSTLSNALVDAAQYVELERKDPLKESEKCVIDAVERSINERLFNGPGEIAKVIDGYYSSEAA